MWAGVVLIFVLLTSPALVQAHEAAHQEAQRLPTIGAAPDVALTSQDGAEVTLESLRGKVVAVAHQYGVVLVGAPDGQVDRTMLTTLVDGQDTARAVSWLSLR